MRSIPPPDNRISDRPQWIYRTIAALEMTAPRSTEEAGNRKKMIDLLLMMECERIPVPSYTASNISGFVEVGWNNPAEAMSVKLIVTQEGEIRYAYRENAEQEIDLPLFCDDGLPEAVRSVISLAFGDDIMSVGEDEILALCEARK